MEQEYRDRVNKFVKKLQDESIDATVLFGQENTRYFTGFQVNQLTESVLIIEQDGSISYLVPRLDFFRAKRDCWIESIHAFLEDTPDYLAPLRKLVKSKWKTIGIEQGSITLHHLSYIQGIFNGNLKAIEQLMTEQRKVKTANEIVKLRKAGEIASLTMNMAKNYIVENKQITEREVTGFAKYVMDKNGAENYSFEPFIMSGIDSALPRRVSSMKSLKEGELILFDMGCIYQGYCSDITRTFCLGEASEEQKEIYQIALEAQQLAIKTIKPGVIAQEVDRVARDFIKKHGFGEFFPHLTGHGLGIGIHEYPIIDEGEESILEENMVVTIEPGVYVPNIGAARIEDMILVTKDGYEYLTSSPREMILN